MTKELPIRAAQSRTCRPAAGALAAAVAAALSACAAPLPSPLPTYRYVGIDLLSGTRGLLYRSGSCVLLQGSDRTIVPIWPEGTRMTAEGLVLPAANGSAFLPFGRVAILYGGTLPDLTKNGRSLRLSAARACGSQGFLVNRAQSQERMQAAAVRPTYTSGLLVRQGACLLLDNVEGALLPIWPDGTVVTRDTVVTPNLRGHAPLIIGGRAGIEGRYVHKDDGSLERAAGAEAARCAHRGMLVEKANRVYLAGTAAELAAMSDAVLVVEVLAVDPSEPLEDAFLTTISARVVEPLTGRFRAGEIIKLRHAAGRDPARGWQVATHDPVFGPFGSTTIKARDRLLLYVNQDFYRQMAEARGGGPVPGYMGAGGGIYRIENDRILNQGSIRMPATLGELRQELRR